MKLKMFYPRFVKGNPQLRIFLPDWKLILVKPKAKKDFMPDNVLTFKTDPKMTDWDIKNYLEKIYNIKVTGIKSKIFAGQLKGTTKGISKLDDYRIAHVTLPLGETFVWPELFKREDEADIKRDTELTIKELNKNRIIDPNVRDIPNWFL